MQVRGTWEGLKKSMELMLNLHNVRAILGWKHLGLKNLKISSTFGFPEFKINFISYKVELNREFVESGGARIFLM
jgi:hypothetical protein